MPKENRNGVINILVIEDNPGDLVLLEDTLRDTDLHIGSICPAGSLEEAKKVLAEEHMDLVFLDLSLPDSYGLDSFTGLADYALKLPVILLTGMSDTKVALQALLLGAQDYLIKGEFDEKLLSRAIRYSLERKRNLENVQESEERYRALFQNNPMPMWIFDTGTFRILEANAEAIHHYGYSQEEFLQKTLADIRLNGRLEDLRAEVDEVVLGKEVMRKGLWQHVKKNGDIIFVEVAWQPIRYKGLSAILLLSNDVTARIQLEEELNQQRLSRQKQITEAVIVAQEKERTEIGKELHDNVNQILGAANLYVNTAMVDEDLRQELLERSTELLTRAVNEIRKISKSLITPGLREIGLIESIEDIMEDLKLARGIAVNLEIQDILEEEIEDRRKLTLFRIVQEQLNNIVKHAKAKSVNIRLLGEDGNLILTIADDGVGFDVNRHRKGVGITNIISRAEIFNGNVEIHSTPGDGCVLEVRLPLG
jgi:two-component system sensor histidine kinase UhpB